MEGRPLSACWINNLTELVSATGIYLLDYIATRCSWRRYIGGCRLAPHSPSPCPLVDSRDDGCGPRPSRIATTTAAATVVKPTRAAHEPLSQRRTPPGCRPAVKVAVVAHAVLAPPRDGLPASTGPALWPRQGGAGCGGPWGGAIHGQTLWRRGRVSHMLLRWSLCGTLGRGSRSTDSSGGGHRP